MPILVRQGGKEEWGRGREEEEEVEEEEEENRKWNGRGVVTELSLAKLLCSNHAKVPSGYLPGQPSGYAGGCYLIL